MRDQQPIDCTLPWADAEPEGQPDAIRIDGKLIRKAHRRRENDVDPCPCDGCTWETACQNGGIACKVYAGWLGNGRVREGERLPTGDVYRRLFGRA